MLPDGKYAVPCGNAQARLFWIRSFDGRQVVYYYKGGLKANSKRTWVAFAFVLDDAGTIQMHKQREATWSQKQVESVRKAVRLIASDPTAANRLYFDVT